MRISDWSSDVCSSDLQIGGAMANLKQITRNDVDGVLEEFRQEADQFMAVTLGSDEYIRSVLTKALGTDRAAGLIEDILEGGEGGNGIDALNWLDANSVAELIADEHHQINATRSEERRVGKEWVRACRTREST